MKTWYKVSSKGGGWSKYGSLQELLDYKKNFPHFPVLKITKVTEEVMSQEIVDEINGQINYVD